MECTLCNTQYVEKAETWFNINLNNHRNDTKNPKALLACRHFQEQGHNFNSHAKFIIIDKLILPAPKTFYANARLVYSHSTYTAPPICGFNGILLRYTCAREGLEKFGMLGIS